MKEMMEQVKMLNSAKNYLEKWKLLDSVQKFFKTEKAREVVHRNYVAYEAEVAGFCDSKEVTVNEVYKSKLREIREEITGKENLYLADIKDTVIVNLYQILMAAEDYIDMDYSTVRPFKEAFESENNMKLLEFINMVAEKVSERMLEKMTMLTVMLSPKEDPLGMIAMMVAMAGESYAEFGSRASANEDDLK